MISFDSSNIFAVDPTHGLTKDEFRSHASSLYTYLKKIHERTQGFYTVIDDDNAVRAIEEYTTSAKGKFDDIVLLGIGGSALGAICLREALRSRAHATLKCRLYVLDNIDPQLIADVESQIDINKTLFIVVSKSGGTIETLSQYRYFKSRGAKHFVFITDPKIGELRKIANQEGIVAFDVPPDVGGRFSVLTPVGLLPASLIGIDIAKLLSGARAMRDRFLNEKFEENLPFQMAAIQYLLAEKGKTIHVMMPYANRLFRFADWYRQLLAESIGKDGKGITPINGLGVTDQHSMLQLYNDGPNDKFFIFIKVENFGVDLQIPESVTFTKLIHTEMKGTIQALTQSNRPNMTIDIDEINEKTLGALFMLFEGATAFLGEFYGINAFDQPGVELSKKLTLDALRKM